MEGVPSPWLGALVRSELAAAIEARGTAEARAELESFLYIVSHDLLAPVRSIVGFTNLVQRRAAGKLEERLVELLEITQRSAASLQTMVLGLRDLSRVETRSGEIEALSLADLVGRVLRERRSEIELSGAKIEVGELCSVDADPWQLHALIDELIVNALGHADEGAQPEVSISARREGERVELLVADRGSTLDERARERIFQPFHRLDKRESETHAGMGLAICRAIARRHGATLVVRENEGGGNVFVLSMPRSVRKKDPVLA
jgi:signal transduction histidine kinase